MPHKNEALIRSAAQKLANAIDDFLVFLEDADFPLDEEGADAIIDLEKVLGSYLSQEEEEDA